MAKQIVEFPESDLLLDGGYMHLHQNGTNLRIRVDTFLAQLAEQLGTINTTGGGSGTVDLSDPITLNFVNDLSGTATITSGGTTNVDVQINNNSHLHEIDNISGLATQLDALSGGVSSKLNSASYTAQDVLNKVKSLDGNGSGLDADLLGGLSHTTYKKDGDTLFTIEDSGGERRSFNSSQSGDYLKFINGGNISVSWTNVNNGTSADPYDLTLDVVSGSVTREGVVRLYAGVDLDDDTVAATAGAVKRAYDLAITGSGGDGSGIASRWVSPISLDLTGAVTGSVSFDGSEDVTMITNVDPASHAHTIAQVTGLQAELDSKLDDTSGGAGSGLDADLLDGEQGSYYTNADNIDSGTLDSNRLPAASSSAAGVVQLASAGEAVAGTNNTKAMTPADVKAYVDTNAGDGSGGDADTLDGLDSTQFLRSDEDNLISNELNVTTQGLLSFGNASESTIWGNATSLTLKTFDDTGSIALVGDYQGTQRTLARFYVDGGSQIRHKGEVRFNTTNSGVSVTGNLTVNNIEIDENVINVSPDAYLSINAGIVSLISKTGNLILGSLTNDTIIRGAGTNRIRATADGVILYGTATIDGANIVTQGMLASESERGVLQLATQAEVDAGTNNTKVVTPAKMAAYVAANGGSGSGGDADTLDGLDSEYFQQNLSNLSITGINENGTGDRFTALDFYSSDDHTAQSARMQRSGGLDGHFQITSLGSGDINLNPDAGDVTVGGNVVWHTGNQGGGSGLNADLLDGQEGSFYRDASNLATGIVPTNRLPSATTSVAGILETATNAETNDGTANNKAVTPANLAGFTSNFMRKDGDQVFAYKLIFSEDTTAKIGKTSGTFWSGQIRIGVPDDGIAIDRSTLLFDTTDTPIILSNLAALKLKSNVGGINLEGVGVSALTYNGNKVFHAGNDGTGSGLDADTLDGQHGSYYLNASNLNTGTISAARLPVAASGSKGAVEIATTAEALAGTDAGARCITPKTLADYVNANTDVDAYSASKANSEIRMGTDTDSNWDGITFNDGENSFNFWADQNRNTSEPFFKLDAQHGFTLNSGVGFCDNGIVANRIAIGASNIFGTTPYGHESIQLGSSNNLRILFGTTQRLLLASSGAMSLSGSLSVTNSITGSGIVSNGNINASGNINVNGDILGARAFVDSSVRAGGNITADGNITGANVTATSDVRVKEDIETIDNALDKVKAIRGVTYSLIDDETKGRKVGVVAQEIETVLPEVVVTDEDGFKSVAYGNITGLLVEAMKEQSSEIDNLKRENNELKDILADVLLRLDSLENK